jgi:hypothetical protein
MDTVRPTDFDRAITTSNHFDPVSVQVSGIEHHHELERPAVQGGRIGAMKCFNLSPTTPSADNEILRELEIFGARTADIL